MARFVADRLTVIIFTNQESNRLRGEDGCR
jgi:hypothetical protein